MAWRRKPYPDLTWALIVLNCAVFALELLHPGGVHGAVEQWGRVPLRVAAGGCVPGTQLPAWLTLLSSMFLHARPSHLGGNMLLLALLGAGVERRAGPGRFLLIYFGSGILAGIVSTLGMWRHSGPHCGASAAVAGIALAWLLLLPATWRCGWLCPATGAGAVLSWLEALACAAAAAYALAAWIAVPLAIAAYGGGWDVLAFGSDAVHLAGALCGGLLVLPFAVDNWRRYRRARVASSPEQRAG